MDDEKKSLEQSGETSELKENIIKKTNVESEAERKEKLRRRLKSEAYFLVGLIILIAIIVIPLAIKGI